MICVAAAGTQSDSTPASLMDLQFAMLEKVQPKLPILSHMQTNSSAVPEMTYGVC